MFTVEKNGVRKNVKTEIELAMYVAAGWNKVKVQKDSKKDLNKESEKPTSKSEYSKSSY